MDTQLGTGWPFLIGAGRRRDYATLVAPAFLIADREYGVLNDTIQPTLEGSPASVTTVTTPSGRRIAVAYVTHRVTAGDLTTPGAGGVGEEAGDPRDEHSRPLRVIFGFVCPGVSIGEPAEEDLQAAREEAFAAYRRFLHDEERFSVVSSSPFPLHATATTSAAAAVGNRRLAPPTSPTGASGTVRPTSRPAPRPPRLALAIVLTTILAVVLLWFAANTLSPELPPETTTTSTVQTGRTSQQDAP